MARGRFPRFQVQQRGGAGAWFLRLVVVLIAAGYAAWRFAPELLPGFVRLELPASPLDAAALSRESGTKVSATTESSRDPNPPLYKWKDASGVWNVTDRPPPGRAFETLRINPDTNVIPAEPISETPQ